MALFASLFNNRPSFAFVEDVRRLASNDTNYVTRGEQEAKEWRTLADKGRQQNAPQEVTDRVDGVADAYAALNAALDDLFRVCQRQLGGR